MEAAIVLPVIIFVVITVVLIVMFFYSQMTELSKMHMELRSEAGKSTGKTIYKHDFMKRDRYEGELYAESNGIGNEIYGKKYLIMPHKGVLRQKGIFTVEGSCCSIDAVKYVRWCNFVKEYGNEQ